MLGSRLPVPSLAPMQNTPGAPRSRSIPPRSTAACTTSIATTHGLRAATVAASCRQCSVDSTGDQQLGVHTHRQVPEQAARGQA